MGVSEAQIPGQAEPDVLAKVSNGRSPYSELNGAIEEGRGWIEAIESGANTNFRTWESVTARCRFHFSDRSMQRSALEEK